MRWIYFAVMTLSAAVWAVDGEVEQYRGPKGAGEPVAEIKPAEPVRQYGDAVVSRVVKMGDGFSFVCCVDDWPEIIGRDITVVVGKIEMPGELGEEGKSFYDKQLAKFLTQRLGSGKVELCNITRAADKFALVADVKVDGSYLAAELIKQGFAKAIEPPAKPAPQQQSDPKGAGEPTHPEPQKEAVETATAASDVQDAAFICSKNSELFHRIDCQWAKRISEKNAVYFKTADQAKAAGKRPCSKCNPE